MFVPAGTRPGPSGPEVMGVQAKGIKTPLPSQVLALQAPGPFCVSNPTPWESGPPWTPLETTATPARPHWGFSHISAALAAAAFYRPRNGSEMGSNLPGRSARICLIPRPSSSPQHQGTHSKVLTSDDTPMEHFTSMSLHSWPEILLAAHWQTSTHP